MLKIEIVNVPTYFPTVKKIIQKNTKGRCKSVKKNISKKKIENKKLGDVRMDNDDVWLDFELKVLVFPVYARWWANFLKLGVDCIVQSQQEGRKSQ